MFVFGTDFAFDAVILIILVPVNSTTGNSVSDANKRSGKISLAKYIALPEENIETTIVATRSENGNEKNTSVSPECGYLNNSLSYD